MRNHRKKTNKTNTSQKTKTMNKTDATKTPDVNSDALEE
jgi:hypothetical protein